MEVRKIISQVIKRILDQCDKDHCDKISKVVTGAEGSVVQAMHSKIDKEWFDYFDYFDFIITNLLYKPLHLAYLQKQYFRTQFL